MSAKFSSIGIIAVRISRLVADGTPDFLNATGALALCAGISSFEYDHDILEGEELVEVDGRGLPCVIRKLPDSVKRTTFSLTMCTTSHMLDEILDVADAVTDSSGDVIGKVVNVAAGCSGGSLPNGVAIELWSDQWDCNATAADPYLRSVLPRAYLTPAGHTKENGVSKYVYRGFSVPNPNFGDGPFGDLDDLVAHTSWSYAELDDAALPDCLEVLDYEPLPSGAS